MKDFLQRLMRSRYVGLLEGEVIRLRTENRALTNSLLGTAGFPPISPEDDARRIVLYEIYDDEAAFERAVEEVTAAAHRLLTSLHTHAPARDRATEAEKAKERSRLRFG